MSSESPKESSRANSGTWPLFTGVQWAEYTTDFWQRYALYWDVMRQRGNRGYTVGELQVLLKWVHDTRIRESVLNLVHKGLTLPDVRNGEVEFVPTAKGLEWAKANGIEDPAWRDQP